MSYDWEDAEEGSSGDKLPFGIHKVVGVKTVHGRGPKGEWVMVVVEDNSAREATAVFTLTDKAAWKLARWLSRCGVDLKAMKAEGIEPKHFTNEEIAKQYLVGKWCWVRVSAGSDPKYLDLEPLKEDEAKEAAVKAPLPPPPEDQPCPVHGAEPCPLTCMERTPF